MHPTDSTYLSSLCALDILVGEASKMVYKYVVRRDKLPKAFSFYTLIAVNGRHTYGTRVKRGDRYRQGTILVEI